MHPNPLKRIISGGQRGADHGALIAAKAAGIETCGWAPRGWRTEDGPDPELGSLYGLVEHGSADYPPRTYCNVANSDGTIRFAGNFNSPGEKKTLEAIQKLKKHYLDVDVWSPHQIETVAEWIRHHEIETLNIAGNRESTCPGIREFVVSYLGMVFDCLWREKMPNNSPSAR